MTRKPGTPAIELEVQDAPAQARRIRAAHRVPSQNGAGWRRTAGPYSPHSHLVSPLYLLAAAFCFLDTTVDGFGGVQWDSVIWINPPVGPGTAP